MRALAYTSALGPPRKKWRDTASDILPQNIFIHLYIFFIYLYISLYIIGRVGRKGSVYKTDL